MGLRDLFRRQKTEHLPTDAPAQPWRTVDDEDMTPGERAMYELAINSAMRGGETMVIDNGDHVTVNGVKYASLEEATSALKGTS